MSLPPGALAAIGFVLIAAGLGTLVWSRATGGGSGEAHLPGVGRVSVVSLAVLGLALLGVGYHALAYAFGWTGFRAPMRIAVGVALVAIVGSLVIDRLENRPEPGDVDDDQAGGPTPGR